jgi:CRP/FNR family cyclic AMP-dependent transcriptional regulator
MSSPDGRQTTVRYVEAGQVLGVLRILAAPFAGSAHALVDSTSVRFDPEVFRSLAAADVDFARALVDELAIGYAHTAQTMALQAFGSIRQKVAFDLLERARLDQLAGGGLEATATQQDIADAIGSVRAVVGRALTELRRGGLIESSRGRIRILAPDRLDALAQAGLVA